MSDLTKVRPLHNWIFCRPVSPKTETESGLIMPKDFDKDVVTEGVAEVIHVGPGKVHEETGLVVDHGIRPGDKVLYRGFLRYAQQLGDMFGCNKSSDVFAISADDLLAVVEGSGTLGYYGEFKL